MPFKCRLLSPGLSGELEFRPCGREGLWLARGGQLRDLSRQTRPPTVQGLQGKLPNVEFLLPQLVAGCDPPLLVTLGDLWLQVLKCPHHSRSHLFLSPISASEVPSLKQDQ